MNREYVTWTSSHIDRLLVLLCSDFLIFLCGEQDLQMLCISYKANFQTVVGATEKKSIMKKNDIP